MVGVVCVCLCVCEGAQLGLPASKPFLVIFPNRNQELALETRYDAFSNPTPLEKRGSRIAKSSKPTWARQ